MEHEDHIGHYKTSASEQRLWNKDETLGNSDTNKPAHHLYGQPPDKQEINTPIVQARVFG